MDRRAQFLKIYANLPSAARDEIVVVVNGQPYTWNSARIEIDQNTPIGKQIIEILKGLEIFPNE